MASRCLYVATKTKVKRYVLGKNTKPLVLVQNRLFRCDEDFMVRSKTSGEEFVCYNIDSTQPLGVGIPVDTNRTMAYIRIARASKSAGSVSILSTFSQIKSSTWMWLFVIVVVAYAFLSGGI